ncbi:uncharacterized protein LOC110253017 [Exaiptasia diaphana]|uniref:Rubisco LSMT substrate-binding domain-containing protein n=1 Tax=Exaiptasia diaphana TaxID=2652724 RepID=A0A913Y5N0_EXADI|nr:uncharacterized protein LOC110253017 [Exaiptasia diaphana]KXJ19694.1 hypothetical protein AC249_AIPGENE25877 [Exaiptasia diaphana]
MMDNTKPSNKRPLNLMFFLHAVSLVVLLTTANDTNDDLGQFTKWLHDHGSKFRCNFSSETGSVEVIAERRIHDRESVFMIPQTLLINSTVIDSSVLGPSLDYVSMTEASISREKDSEKQSIMHLFQLAIYILYGVHTKDEFWFPYFKLLTRKNEKCHNLWMWTDKELDELQDEALEKRAKKWREEIHMLASNIAPKLVKTGVFPDGISVDDLKNGVCLAQSSSFNITSASGQPVRTLVPVLNLFKVNPDVQCTWWMKDGVLRYRYNTKPIEKGNQIFINLSPTGDSTQMLFEYGVFVSKGSKFVSNLKKANSLLRRRFMTDLKIRKKIKYSDKFTFKSAALPYFRIEALTEPEVEKITKEVANNESLLLPIKKVIKSPSIYVKSDPYFSCKSEVVALNTLAVHLRDELKDKPTTIPEDEKIMSKTLKPRHALAVSFRLRFKKLVTKFLDATSARSVTTKKECLSRDKDEL